MDIIVLVAAIVFLVAILATLFKLIRKKFFSSPKKLFVAKGTGAKYTKSEQDLREFR